MNTGDAAKRCFLPLPMSFAAPYALPSFARERPGSRRSFPPWRGHSRCSTGWRAAASR